MRIFQVRLLRPLAVPTVEWVTRQSGLALTHFQATLCARRSCARRSCARLHFPAPRQADWPVYTTPCSARHAQRTAFRPCLHRASHRGRESVTVRRLSSDFTPCLQGFKRKQHPRPFCLFSLITPLPLSWPDCLLPPPPLSTTQAQPCFSFRPASWLSCWPRKCLCWDGKGRTWDLTAFLRRTVSATTVLPRLAYSGSSVTAGQAVMGMYSPTTIVLGPNWQESAHLLHKRAPTGDCK